MKTISRERPSVRVNPMADQEELEMYRDYFALDIQALELRRKARQLDEQREMLRNQLIAKRRPGLVEPCGLCGFPHVGKC